MNIVVLTPVRLMGDGLVACFGGQPDIRVTAVVDSLDALRAILQSPAVDLVLVDVTQGIDLYDIRGIAFEHPEISLVALGLDEQRQEVIRCGRRGYAGYVARNASVETLCHALIDVVQGRLACPAEISGSLLRALFRREAGTDESLPASSLTRREGDVLQLIGGGHSNKEIAIELHLSVATVKHHVHNILDKLKVSRRAQAMRQVRDSPWLVTRDMLEQRHANDRTAK